MWTDRIILELCRRFPAEETIFQPSQGRAEAEYARMSAEPFLRLFGRTVADLRGQCVLDLGSGFGSQAVHYAEAGARQVIGLEIEEDKVLHSRAFAKSKGVADVISFVAGAGEQLPFASDSFDLITMDDVMEHVVTPELVLRECFRCLKPGGSLLMVFPPYYCVVGGSHLGGYATRVPGLNLLFSAKRLKSGVVPYLEEAGQPWRSYLREVPSDKLWNLNGLTIAKLQRLLAQVPFEADIWLMGLRDRRKPSPRRPLPTPLFLAFEASAKVPLVREAMCSRVVAELTKPNFASWPPQHGDVRV